MSEQTHAISDSFLRRLLERDAYHAADYTQPQKRYYGYQEYEIPGMIPLAVEVIETTRDLIKREPLPKQEIAYLDGFYCSQIARYFQIKEVSIPKEILEVIK